LGYGYDELGRLSKVQTALKSAFYYYDQVGNRDYMELELNGSPGYEVKTDYTYDNLNRLTDLIQQKTGAVQLASYNYQLKANGMRRGLDENFPTNEDRDIVYTYDNLSRLIQEDADSSGDGYTATYEYDLAGNRTQRIVSVNAQLDLTTVYTYDPNTDRLIKETHSGPVYSFLDGNEQYYAFAAGGKSFYYRDLHGNKIGSIRAFFIGLPSVWSRYLFALLMVLLPVMLFGPAVVGVIRRLVYCYGRPTRLRLRVPRKGICLLVAFVMLFGPEHFDYLAQADVQYANLSTATWAQGDATIEYTYDANGSVETKTTKVTSTQAVEETVTYDYNLQNRLAKVTTEDENGDKHIAEYTYNDEGVRVRSYTYDIPSGQSVQNEKTTVYLVDSYNHTGYAQTLEEKSYNGTDTSGVPDSLTTYLIGDDVIAQTTDGDTQYLLYDGHGSTRQLVEYDGSVTITDSYSYDGYGVLLQDDVIASAAPGKVSPQQTNLLYAGEHFDTDTQQYYLRARYYNPQNGLFNRMDPFSGNTEDPQSLHKYLYCYANPINNIDPSGLGLVSVVISIAMYASLVISIIPHAFRAFFAAKEMLKLTDFTNFIRRLANRGVIDFFIAESIRAEAFYTFAELLGTIGESLIMIANKIIEYYAYNMAFAAITQVAMGGIETSVQLSRASKVAVEIGDDIVHEHHLVFECAVKEGVKNERTWSLAKSLHTARGTGLHSRIWKSERFSKLLPRRGKPMKEVIRGMGKQKWLDEMGECYKWLETQHSGYKGIYEAYQRAVVDIGGAKGLI
jgi:RHS repeat-associated protein